jgi:hypothetical protein
MSLVGLAKLIYTGHQASLILARSTTVVVVNLDTHVDGRYTKYSVDMKLPRYRESDAIKNNGVEGGTQLGNFGYHRYTLMASLLMGHYSVHQDVWDTHIVQVETIIRREMEEITKPSPLNDSWNLKPLLCQFADSTYFASLYSNNDLLK